MKFLSLFSGIGSPEMALRNIGAEYELVGFSEIDKFAIKSYCAIHGVSSDLNLGDISKIKVDTLPKVDLIVHGSPCQDFSISGKGKGGDIGSNTRSSLMWNTINIIKHCEPKFVIWENVKNILSKTHRHNFENYMNCLEDLGYKNYYRIVNAKDFGIPQNRERIFVVSIRNDLNKQFEFPKEKILNIRLKDILEENVNSKYYISDDIVEKFKQQKADEYNEIPMINQLGLLDIKGNEQVRRVYGIEGIAPTLSTMQGGNRQPKILINEKIRKLTPLECWRLMGFSDEDFYKIRNMSDSQIYKQLGNSIVVQILENIYKNLL